MKGHVFLPCFGRILAALAITATLGAAAAAQAAQDHTMLYYLMEMQRRVKRSCQGQAMPEAPSLIPSERLRAVAAQSLHSGRPPEALGAGLEGIAFVTLTGKGNTPQQVLDFMLAGQCPALMGTEYRFVGAEGQSGRWVAILSASEPDSRNALVDGQNAGQQDGAYGTDFASEREPGQMSEQASGPAASQTAASHSGRQSGSQSGSQSGPQSGWIDGGEVRYPASRAGEAAPAPAVPVGEMSLDASGRPTGALKPLDPGFVPSFEESNAFDPAWSAESPNFGQQAAPGTDMPGSPQADTLTTGPAPGPDSFIPPTEPGPFGARTAPQPQSRPVQSGVVPLRDSRPPMPEDPMVYRAPGSDTADESGLYQNGPEGQTMPFQGVPGQPLGSYDEFESSEAPVNRNPALAPTPSPRGTDPVRTTNMVAQDARATTSVEAATLLALVNAERAHGGMCGSRRMSIAPPLHYSPALANAAKTHVADMAARGYFASSSPDGPKLGNRVSATGYMWSLVAENLANMQGSAQDVMMAWLTSPEQCANMLSQEFTEVGAALDSSGRYWVLTLAAPANLEEDQLRLTPEE